LNQLGVFIIWQSGENYAQDIIEDIKTKFNLIMGETLEWNSSHIGERLNKLYPHRQFDYNSSKVKEIGADKIGVRLHFIVVKDLFPNMNRDNINLNFKEIKEFYRKKYKTNFLHSSDNQREAIDNIKTILNYNESKIKNLISFRHNKFVLFNYSTLVLMSTERVKFNSIEDVFSKLDAEQIHWVVLRNWDELDNDIITLAHGDVDILVDDLYKTILILNGVRGTNLNYRVQYKISIDGQEIPFDIRYVGDDYYDKNWEQEILRKREKKDYFYIPNKDNYYYSLLYHALVHKPKLSEEYTRKLSKLSKYNPTIENLKTFLTTYDYKITKPKDKSVYYRYSKKHYIYIFKQLIKGVLLWIRK
jgi:hypothetical protein